MSPFLSVGPPKVIQHPETPSVSTEVETTFKIEATGGDLTFHWQKNGSNVHNNSNYSGTDTNTLSIRHVNKNDGGQYRCIVKNEVKMDGKVSEDAQLTVCESVLQCLFCTVAYLTAIHKVCS